MLSSKQVNLSSLNIVAEELENTILLAQENWVAFDIDTDNTTQLKSVSQSLGQINGALRIVELDGAETLGVDMGRLAHVMLEQPEKRGQPARDAFQRALAAIPRYLKLVRASGRNYPQLLLPVQNEVRSFAGLPRVAENHYEFLPQVPAIQREALDSAFTLDTEKITATGRRLRQMYQTGLIGVLRDPEPTPHLGLMQRAVERLYGMLKTRAAGDHWWLVAAVLEGLSNCALELTASRRRWLSSVDTRFRDLLSDVEHSLDVSVNSADANEMLYLIGLAPDAGDYSRAVVAALSLHCDMDDRELRQQRAFLYGGGAALSEHTLESIEIEIGVARDVLEHAGKKQSCDSQGLEALQTALTSIHELLGDAAGLTVQQLVEAQLHQLGEWIANDQTIKHDALMPVADLLVMMVNVVETSRQGIVGGREIESKLVNTELVGAELAVIKEAQAGINLSKRAITSFLESDFDAMHISNVSVTLNSVRGGLALLDLPRASTIIGHCISFIDEELLKQEKHDVALLETLADALISLEYYLGQLEVRKDADDTVLKIADESLAALGYGNHSGKS